MITQRSAATSTGPNGTVPSISIYKPIGIAENDVLVAGITVQGNRTITPPTGWQSIRRDVQGTNLTQQLFYKVAGSNEPGLYTWTFSATDNAVGGIVPYVGVNTASPIDQSSGNVSTSNSANVVATSITTTGANYMVVGFFGVNKNFTFTPDASMNEEWDRPGTGPGAIASEAADYTAPAGATGNKTAVASGSKEWIGQLVSLKLDAAAPTQALSVTEGTRPDLQFFNSGTNTMYYNPAATGDFTVTSAITDAGASQVTFPALSTTGFTHTSAYRNQVLADEPLAYWRLGEPSGTSAADASGNGNTGTYGGSPTLGATGALAGDTDTATSFDGVNDNVSVPNNAVLNLNGSFSIEFWAKQTSFTNTTPGILNKGASGTANGYLISAGNTGILSFKRNNVTLATAAGSLTTAYKHFALTYDGTTVRWYVNGVAGTSSALALPANASAAALTIGLGDAGQYANDAIDDVAIYQTALSTTRIAEHYNVGISSSRDEIDTQSPFTSADYSFGASNTTAPGASTITGLDGANNSVTTNLTFVRDVTAPTGVSATVTAGYYTSLSVPVTLANGSDSGSGVDATTGIVERDEVVLDEQHVPGFRRLVVDGHARGRQRHDRPVRQVLPLPLQDLRPRPQPGDLGRERDRQVDTSAPPPHRASAYGSSPTLPLSAASFTTAPARRAASSRVTAPAADRSPAIAGYNFPAASWRLVACPIVGNDGDLQPHGSPVDPVEPRTSPPRTTRAWPLPRRASRSRRTRACRAGQSVALSGGP